MMWKRSFVMAVLTAFVLLLNASLVLAGTTGTVSGSVISTAGKPVAGARVTAVSPSQTSTTTTDNAGHFALLSLAPDTYTITAEKDGFDTGAEAGISIFADQVQNIRIALTPSLKTIARVTTRSSMDLVKSGTTADVYSVNSAVAQAAAGVGGGGNLNNAYSAIATVPGVFVPPNQQGWDQVVYIRGGNYDQVGYEYDGVPVNRSFDNYPGSTAGTLGQQELQVYSGGGTVGQSTSGLAGFINQVIKTGTYPGFANVNAGLGTPTYYHNLQVEVGGATPDRLFSYYAGIGGYNQDFRYLDQFNGQNLGLVWGYPTIAFNRTFTFFGGDYPICQFTPPAGQGYYNGPNGSPVYDPFALSPGQPGYIAPPVNTEQPQKYYGGVNDPGCYNTVSPAYFNYSNLVDRETVINLHFGIPHKHDAGRDDVQLLYNPVALHTQYYSSGNDIGPNLVTQLDELAGYGNVPLIWGDFVTWPSGTHPGQSATGISAIPYMMPSSPGNRCANVYPVSGIPSPPGSCGTGTYANVPYSAVPLDSRDSFWNDSSIVKVQYQHNMGSNAYIRVYGYTFFSDWLQTSPLSYGSFLYGLGATSYDYELESHTRGIALTFADQLNSEHLLTFDTNYTTATTNRFNNTTFNNYLNTNATNLTNGTQCFAMFTGPVYPGTPINKTYNPVIQAGQPAPCNSRLSSGTFGDPTDAYECAAGTLSSSSSISCLTSLPKGSSWQVTSSGTSGFLNQVTPEFTTLSLQDQWNPTEQLNIQIGLRDENYQYNLANTTSNGQNFWFLADQHEFCYDPKTLAPLFIPVPPASGRPANPFIGLNCPSGYVHPDGQNGHLLLSNNYGPTINDNAFTPRLGLTYTINPDTVIRLSAGRFAQPPQTYQVQYNARDSNLAYDLFQAFWQYGYTTPRHDPLVQYSNNYDASLEKRLKGTDMSIKLTPYYRYATNQVYGISLPYGLGGGFNSGTERVDGVEFEFTKGDFDRDGLSMIFSYTYTNAAEKWNNFPNSSINPIDQYNQDIANFNALTKAGGGAACYYNNAPSFANGYQGPGNVVADPNCAPIPAGQACKVTYTSPTCYNPVIRNPYYNTASQPLLDRNGWYPVGLDFPYLSTNVASLLVNYKHRRFAITPALTFNEGQPYGYPADVYGNDPRTCTRNSAGLVNSPIHKSNPLQADWTSCSLAATQGGSSPGSLFIPNPQTGVFDSFGMFHQPNQLNLSLSMSYDISPRIKVTAMLANLVNACFGGSSEPWTKQFPPNSYTCGYIPNYYYVSNFYNGTSPNDKGANGVTMNPAFASSYIPAYADTNSYVLPNPFNAYFSINVKI
jgi:Carboxypeptidase regulatory-like domain/TonB dependent receptor